MERKKKLDGIKKERMIGIGQGESTKAKLALQDSSKFEGSGAPHFAITGANPGTTKYQPI